MSRTIHPKRIGLFGPFGFGNLGDAAIQRAMIQHLRRRFPDARIVAFSMNPEDTQARHGIPAFPITRKPEKDFARSEFTWKSKRWPGRIAGWFQYNSNPRIRKLERVLVRIPAEIFLAVRAYRDLKGLDVLIFSGGGQLDDLWGGPWKHPYIMYKFSSLARLRRTKVLFVSVGVESVHTFFGKIFVRGALSRASYRSFRDQYSKDFVERMKLARPGNNSVYPDLAHSLDIHPGSPALAVDAWKPVVGVNPVPYYDPRFWPLKDPAVYQDYLEKMAAFINWLVQRQYHVKFIRSDINPDLTAIADIRRVCLDTGFELLGDQVSEPPIQTLDELVAELASTDLVVASRLHSVLLAQRVTRPVVALSYQSKIDKLMEDTGQGEYCLPIGGFDVETLIRRFLKLEANCEEIKQLISCRTQEYRAALAEQYDRIYRLI